MTDTKLTWKSRPHDPERDAPEGPVRRYWAECGPICCLVLEYAYDAIVSDNDEISSKGGSEFHWYAETGSAHLEGFAYDVAEAQARAEAAAKKWLCEGLVALGDDGRVKALEAMELYVAEHESTKFWIDQCKSAEAIIRDRDLEVLQLRKKVEELKEYEWMYKDLCK